MGNQPGGMNGQPGQPGKPGFSTRFTLRGLSWRPPKKDENQLPGVDQPNVPGSTWDSESNWDGQSERPSSWAPWNADGESVRDSGAYDQGTYQSSKGYDESTMGGDSEYDQGTMGSQSRYDASTMGSQSRYDASTMGSQSRYDQSTYGSQSGYDQSTYGSQSEYDASTMGSRQGYDQSTYGSQSEYDASTMGSQSRYDPSTMGSQSRYDASTMGSQSRYDASTMGSQSRYDASTMGSQSRYDQSTYGSQSEYDASTMGSRSGYDQSTYGSQSNYDQSTYGSSAYDQSTYGSRSEYDASTMNSGYSRMSDPYSKGPEFADLYDKLIAYYKKHDPDAINNKEIDISGMTSWCLESEDGSLEELNDKLYDRFGESLEEFENGGPIDGRPYSTMGRSYRDSRTLDSFTIKRGDQSTLGSRLSSVRSLGSRLSSRVGSMRKSMSSYGSATLDSRASGNSGWDVESKGYDQSTMGSEMTYDGDIREELESFFLQYEPDALDDIDEYEEEYNEHGRMALNVKLFRNFGKNLTSLSDVKPEGMGTRKTSKFGIETVDRSVLNELQSTGGRKGSATSRSAKTVLRAFPDFTKKREEKISKMGANTTNVTASLQRKWNHLNNVSRGVSMRVATKIPEKDVAPPPSANTGAHKPGMTPFAGTQSAVKISNQTLPKPRGMRGSVKDITVFSNGSAVNTKTGARSKMVPRDQINNSTMKSTRSKKSATMKSSRSTRSRANDDTMKSSKSTRSSKSRVPDDTMKSSRSTKSRVPDDTMRSSRSTKSRVPDDTMKSSRSSRSRVPDDTMKSSRSSRSRVPDDTMKSTRTKKGSTKARGSKAACSRFEINLEGEFGTCINCGLRKDDHYGGTAPKLAPTLARKFDKINSTA